VVVAVDCVLISSLFICSSCIDVWNAICRYTSREGLREHIRSIHESGSFCLRAMRLFGDDEAESRSSRASRSREVERVSMRSLSPVVLSTTTSTNTFELCTRKFELFAVNSAENRSLKPAHEKSKQHQLRLMNGGGDDDFFFNNNNRQRQTTDNFNECVDNNNSRKTISMPTMHKIIQVETSSS
jgi:hypothetical protein